MLTDYTREIRALTACGAFLLLQSAAAQAASTDTPAAIVIVAHAIAQDGAFTAGSDPRAALWARVPEEEIELKLAPPVHPAIALSQAAVKAARALPLHVSALTDHRRLYLRLRWKDRTHDDRRAMGLFPDAAAVEVPIAATDTAVMMGTPDKPVAIWRWDAAKNEVEALAAGSPGTLTPAVDDGLRGSGSYRELGDAGHCAGSRGARRSASRSTRKKALSGRVRDLARQRRPARRIQARQRLGVGTAAGLKQARDGVRVPAASRARPAAGPPGGDTAGLTLARDS